MTGAGPDRRAVLRAGLTLALGGVTASLAACAPADRSGAPSIAPSTAGSPSPSGSPRVLMAYFSRAGENYWNGGRRVLRTGNTAVMAGIIEDLAEVDRYVIEAADPYPSAYEPTVQRNSREASEDARPEIAEALPDLSGYDVLLLGSPVWGSREPMIMRTFIEGVRLSGMTVHPFVTYAVSGMGSVQTDYTRLIPDATVTDGLDIQGERIRETASRDTVADWLGSIGLT